MFCEVWQSVVWGRSWRAPLKAVSGRLAVLTPSVRQFGPYLAGVTEGIAPHLIDATLFVAWRSMLAEEALPGDLIGSDAVCGPCTGERGRVKGVG